MEDFEWIDDTPANDYEIGEELYFRTSTWVYVIGNYIRQVGEEITVKVSEVNWGPEEWTNKVMTFSKDSICEKLNIDSMFTVVDSYTYTMDEWDYACEEELEDTGDCTPCNPRTIGKVITMGKGYTPRGNNSRKKEYNPILMVA